MTQNSTQSLRQASVRLVSGTTLDYNGDWLALFSQAGISGTRGFNGGMLEWINLKLSSAYTSLATAMNALASNQGVTNFDSLGTFDASLTKNALLLRDGASFLLLDDNSSHLLLRN